MHRIPSSLLQLNSATAELGALQFGAFDFDICAGEQVAILGPSGAGKSTLLKLMSGELAPTKGHIRFLNNDYKNHAPDKLSQHRAVLPQSTHIAFGLQVDLVIGLGRVAIVDDPALNSIINQAAQLACAAHLLTRRFDSLSGGEQARVQLARILAQMWDSQNGLILVDEPIAALDPGLQFELLNNMHRFAAERHHAVVTILHDINHALAYSKRLLLLKAGKIQADIAISHSTITSHLISQLEQLYGITLHVAKTEQGQLFIVPNRQNVL